MLADRWRIEAGERRLNHLIDIGTLTGPVGALLVDIDRSGPIRARGIAAKVRLVGQLQQLIRELTPAHSITIDSGSRDEIYLVLPDASAREILSLSERIRAAVAAHPFDVFAPSAVRVTASVGCVLIPSANSGGEVLERTRDALHQAKQVRDYVYFASTADTRTISFPVRAALVGALEQRGCDMARVLHTGISALKEKHGAMWHWVAKKAGAERGKIPIIKYSLGSTDAPHSAVVFFELILWSVAMEAALTQRAKESSQYMIAVHRGSRPPTGYDLVVRYLPNEWVACKKDVTSGKKLHPNRIYETIQNARDGGESELRKVEVVVGPSAQLALEEIAFARGRAMSALIDEALQLGLDSMRAWQVS